MKILFISHDASRTGAPILLMRLIQVLKSYSDFEIYILLKSGGELENDFKKLGEAFIWNKPFASDSLWRILKTRLLDKVGKHIKSRVEEYHAIVLNQIKDADIVFNNTVCNGELLMQLPLHGKRVFSYFHEMQVITKLVSSRQQMEYIGSISEKVFVPSEAVKEFLIKDYSYPEGKMALLKYIIPDAITSDINCTKMECTRGDKRFNVALCGTLHWRKGYELLPLIMKKVIFEKDITDIHFRWIGADINSTDYIILINDLKKLNLDSFFSVTEPAKNIDPFLNESDVLILPSREDAFPLVVLEAARFEVPCIYFRNAGGISEFCGSDVGLPVDYYDADMMAEKIIELKNNESFRKLLGVRAKEKVGDYSDGKQIINELIQYFSR